MAEKHDHEIFLSYSSKDRAWVSEFADALSEAGIKSWFDASNLLPGERWKEKIQEALRESRVLLIVLSPNSFESPWTFFEIGAAVADSKKIIPIVLGEFDRKKLPLVLENFQYLKESSPRVAGKRVAEVLEKEMA